MNYRLVYTKRAVLDIHKMDSINKKRIGKKIIELSNDPIKKSKKLIDSKLGTYRFRIGNYRVIFDINGKDVVILRVGHRREIYQL